jgi:uncharacterized protein YndB with AHSA1/START domain
MIEIRSEADIACPAETIFDVIVDFGGQDRWLAESSVYRGTTEISSDPVTVGTTYRETGPRGERRGTVMELERPTRLTCSQPLTLRPRFGAVDVTLRYTLVPAGPGSTHVERVVTLGIPPSLRLLQPVLVRAFRAESSRTLLALKAYVETLP